MGAAELGFSAEAGHAKARQAEAEHSPTHFQDDLFTIRDYVATEAWAVDHLSERDAVFSHADLQAAALARIQIFCIIRAKLLGELRGRQRRCAGLGRSDLSLDRLKKGAPYSVIVDDCHVTGPSSSSNAHSLHPWTRGKYKPRRIGRGSSDRMTRA